MKNKYGNSSVLTNEASVEFNFINLLIKDLGYTDEDVSYKESISEIAVSIGRKKVLYKPDFVLKINGIPSVVIDAKAPAEDIDKWATQCSSYCLELNRSYEYNPVQFFCVTNGLKTSLFRWDNRIPLCVLNYSEFEDGSEAYQFFKGVVSKEIVLRKAEELRHGIENSLFSFEPATIGQLNNLFPKLHKLIWQAENKSPSAAFVELMKIVFVKIDKDRILHEKYGAAPKPKYSDVIFSLFWIQNQTENTSPIDNPLFVNLVNSLEKQIASGDKKRIFEREERINLSPETISRIVKEIEHLDFYAMEEDIQGRLFESFLDATIRGKDIGQFFTPRDIVDLMVDLADLNVERNKNDCVLDLCCGSGGFLIASMRNMLIKLKSMVGLSSTERGEIDKRIRRESIFGVDAGSDPAMYKIARMNMYLHGDGGSRIYFANSLNKKFGRVGPDSIENNEQLRELQIMVEGGKKFEVILSNPPFSMAYSRNNPEQCSILNTFEIATKNRYEKKLLSSVMFIERYRDLVSTEGRILAIIDDSILSGESYIQIRQYIKENFIVLGIVSLPGDAFKRASGRVKTSILILRVKKKGEIQGEIFTAISCYLGIERKIAKRIGIEPEALPALKQIEHDKIVSEYRKFASGKKCDGVISPENINDRMDVKYCINDRGRRKKFWEENGYGVTTLERALKLQTKRSTSVEADGVYPLVKVTYEGEVLDGEVLKGEDCSYSKLFQLHEWDILISNMGVGRGAVSIVPPHHSMKFVSSEYTILCAKSKTEAVFYVNILRSEEILADILACTTGMNRGRIKWNTIAQVEVPICDKDDNELKSLVDDIEQFWLLYTNYSKRKRRHESTISEKYGIEGEDSHIRWLGFKPPE